VEFAPLGLSYREHMHAPDPKVGRDQLRERDRRYREDYSAMLRDSWAAARGCDLLVYNLNAFHGCYLAETLKIPAVGFVSGPFVVPTRSLPFAAISLRSLGGPLNLLSYRFLRLWMLSHHREMAHWAQQALGMRPRPRLADYMRVHGRELPIMHFCSERLVPRPPDWSPGHVMTGFWELPADEGWQPTAGLLEFLQAGEPPVCLGYSSVGIADPAATTRVALGALRRAGQRGVLLGGWGSISAEELPETVHFEPFVPHHWLYPRAKAVVHHGGAGSTWAGLRWSKPTVICPFCADQPFWAKRLHELGVSPPPLPLRSHTEELLGEAIRAAVSDPRMAARAAELGEALAREDGVGNAVRYIEGLVRSPHEQKTVNIESRIMATNTKKTRVALVYPPFGPPNLPSLGLAILSAGLKGRGFRCDTYYWNYSFLRHLPDEELSGKLATYTMLGIRAIFPWNEYPFLRYVLPALAARDEEVKRILARMDEQYGHLRGDAMPPGALVMYLYERMDEILSSMGDGLEPYDVIGIGSTFFQNGPALALAWHIKRRWPEKTLILGGANCDGEMGAALLEKFPFVDFTFSGEVDHSFPEFIDRLDAGAAHDDVSGLCYRDAAGVVRQAPHQAPLQDLDSLPFPDFDDYLAQRNRYELHDAGHIILPLESSRGCWWGAKQHCTFCGLNANGMAFRQKSQDHFKAEVEATVGRYRTRFLFMADNILSLEYFKDFMKWSAERRLGIDFFYEIKSNVKREQGRRPGRRRRHVGAAGYRELFHQDSQAHAQRRHRDPQHRLHQARRGVRRDGDLQHPRRLPRRRSRGVRAHVPEPAQARPPATSRRGRPDRVPPLQPLPPGSRRVRNQAPPGSEVLHLYPFPEEEVARLCYVFEAEVPPESRHLDQLQQTVMAWSGAYQSSGCTLTWGSAGDAIHVNDRRQGFPPTDYRLTGFAPVVTRSSMSRAP
jgi:sterol 3beta-glucosyltransferase